MNAGRMDRRITIQNYTVQRDSWNHPRQTWTTLHTVWAHKREVVLREQTELQQRVGYTRTHFKIRYVSGIDTTMRVEYDNQHYYVIGVKELGRQEGLELITELRE